MKITFTVNNENVEVDVKPNETLLDVLREKLYLTGAKEGCGNGECGACTVIYNGRPVNSCLVLAPEAEGAVIETVEGLTKDNKLHPIQEAFIEANAFQCGYCTPGFIMSTKAMLEKVPNPTKEVIVERLAGNLCRCTGYTVIIDAVKLAAQKMGGAK
ncbi:(2Fe-2S)-binding protein [Marinitoga sp. 1135]|uniref:Aerobic-type carbon monoxide dehydrogenase, small subunit CoxS/CutS-like protein n=1 Tax=Marinitoga piezophila (strain DSM 14283 / JCM 11233 / KA3) TaxID=443254 RepID=H2J550_MARPK|nr:MULTISPECIES: (2Fe-2S)-binding protein [Marinitoga]AEX86067.1 aerobic-type carbon monoxide dehydrogenase, small subunit CoxS/CutS-like protein [Marinitoga piezophila KA3]APT76485.1 (2Fe-2S)-binding protein [Marinitoga sp. 1137]NUU96255.1 (2Fe-2S)-binding protein [Marinitoga sp. 1135]NUU98174.1 (2Fe-2S)-binding protein [Marinitoga sp. 1138]